MKFHRYTGYFYTLGFILAALIFSSIGMTYSILNIDGKGMVVWGVVVIACGVVLGTVIKEL